MRQPSSSGPGSIEVRVPSVASTEPPAATYSLMRFAWMSESAAVSATTINEKPVSAPVPIVSGARSSTWSVGAASEPIAAPKYETSSVRGSRCDQQRFRIGVLQHCVEAIVLRQGVGGLQRNFDPVRAGRKLQIGEQHLRGGTDRSLRRELGREMTAFAFDSGIRRSHRARRQLDSAACVLFAVDR